MLLTTVFFFKAAYPRGAINIMIPDGIFLMHGMHHGDTYFHPDDAQLQSLSLGYCQYCQYGYCQVFSQLPKTMNRHLIQGVFLFRQQALDPQQPPTGRKSLLKMNE